MKYNEVIMDGIKVTRYDGERRVYKKVRVSASEAEANACPPRRFPATYAQSAVRNWLTWRNETGQKLYIVFQQS